MASVYKVSMPLRSCTPSIQALVLGSGRNTQITGENKNNELDLKGDRKRRLESLGTNVMIAMTFELNRGRQCALHNPPTQKN